MRSRSGVYTEVEKVMRCDCCSINEVFPVDDDTVARQLARKDTHILHRLTAGLLLYPPPPEQHEMISSSSDPRHLTEVKLKHHTDTGTESSSHHHSNNSRTKSRSTRSNTSSLIDKLSEGAEPREARKGVSFDKVSIRAYQQTVGDNPCVTDGIPIQLDWEYEEREPVSIALYEACMQKPRRTSDQLMLSEEERKDLLQVQYGFSEETLRQAERDADKIKRKRSITNALPTMAIESAIESAKRKACRLVKIGRRKKKKPVDNESDDMERDDHNLGEIS